MKRIAVLTSGGDAPGMNAAVRAVARTAVHRGWEVIGVERGFAGLLEGRLRPLGARDVAGILQRAGTMLGSARSPEFKTEAGQRRAIEALSRRGADALVVVGGNGSQTGALALSRRGLPVVGVASTIDNDLAGTDVTIGADTAVNIAVEAIDRLKTTASSHQRVQVVEVMGRDCGYLALLAGLAGGAEAIVLPGIETDPEDLARTLHAGYDKGKTHGLVVVAEGAALNAVALARFFSENRERIRFDARITILGHVQRGGDPTVFDRILATELGAGAVDALARGEANRLVGRVRGEVVATPLEEVVGRSKPLDPRLLELAGILDA